MTEKETLHKVGVAAIQEFSSCWKLAWNDIRGPFNHPDHSPRIRSDLLREHAAIHGQRALPKFGYRYLFEQGQHLFLTENVVVVFRKLDEFRQPHRPATERGEMLFQSKLFEMPTLIVGMLPNPNWTAFIGIFLLHPNTSNLGMAWSWEITNGITAIDADQSRFVNLIDETETKKAPKPKKFKAKYDPNIGESSEEAGPGGSPAS